MDLQEFLASGAREVPLVDCFPVPNFAAEAYARKLERSLSRVFLRTLEAEGLEAAVAEYRATRINHSEILNQLAAFASPDHLSFSNFFLSTLGAFSYWTYSVIYL